MTAPAPSRRFLRLVEGTVLVTLWAVSVIGLVWLARVAL